RAAGLEGDGGARAVVAREREAPLGERGQRLEAAERAQRTGHGLEPLGIVGGGAMRGLVDGERARGIGERSGEQAPEALPGDCALAAVAQRGRERLLPARGRVLDASGPLERLAEAEPGAARGVVGGDRPLEGLGGARRLAGGERAGAEIGEQRGPLGRPRDALRLARRERERLVPATGRGAARAQPAQGGREARIERERLALAGFGALGIEARLVERMAQAVEQARPVERGARALGGGEVALVERHQLLPLPVQEVVLLERRER